MNIVQMFRKCFWRKPIVPTDQLRTMAQTRQFREVIEIYKNRQIDPKAPASDLIGYCYYQLTNYSEAIGHLKKALAFWPKDYYSSFFLAVCLNCLNKKTEAIAQFLNCLHLHEDRAGEILEHLLPLASEIADFKKCKETFAEINTAIAKLGPTNPYIAKVLFYQRRESEITPEMLQGSLFCRFYCAKDLTDAGHGRFISLGKPEKLRFVRFGEVSDLWVDTCPPYVAEISNAKIVSGSSLIFVDENQILSEALADKEFGQFADMQYEKIVSARRNDALLVKQFEPETEISQGIMLCGITSRSYGHWFAEFLPKLRFFENHPRFSEIPIIIDEGMPQSHYDFLSILTNNPTHRLAQGSSLRIKNLLVAPTDTFFPLDLVKNHKVPPERQSNLTIGALRYIGEKIRKHFGETTNPTSRIFLSRRSSQWRRLLNEKLIIEELHKLNFKTVYIEDFTFEKQVQIFRSAEFIVAPNGSALNNLIFSNPNIKVLVLGQKHLFNWGGWFGSFMELGYSLQYLSDDSIGNKNEKHLDYSIPVSIVKRKVKEMLNS